MTTPPDLPPIDRSPAVQPRAGDGWLAFGEVLVAASAILGLIGVVVDFYLTIDAIMQLGAKTWPTWSATLTRTAFAIPAIGLLAVMAGVARRLRLGR